MGHIKSKSTFRVFLIESGKYYSKSRSKSTWLTVGWALSAARESGYPLSSIEIHEFPASQAIVYNAKDLWEAGQEEHKIKVEEKKKAEEENRKRWEIHHAKEAIRKAEETLRKYNDV